MMHNHHLLFFTLIDDKQRVSRVSKPEVHTAFGYDNHILNKLSTET